ncbi:hypothetical protein [Brevibacterium samyangense]|uniref:DUF4129 domain-containing protein n=1 Tax=Brevibacterium samyangense TaxID=366888 RepID=A0ABN2TMH2_9MICO
MGGTELHPAMAASSWWLALAILGGFAALFLVGIPLWRFFMRRRGTPGELSAVPEHVRTEYMHRIDEVANRWRAGERSDRELAQDLGVVVRDFAKSAWDIRIDHMTLRELHSSRIRPIAEVVDRLYAAEFSPEGSPSGGTAELQAAKELVGRWS